MTYDFHGSWGTVTDHNAPFENPSKPNWSYTDALNRWLGAGAPADRLVGGFAFYGRAVVGVSDPTNNGGLGSPFSKSSSSGDRRAVYDARDLLDAETTGVVTGSCSTCGGVGFVYYWDAQQKVPYLYNGDEWISYDNLRSTCIKAKFSRELGLRGGMAWELAADDGRLQELVVKILITNSDAANKALDCSKL